MRVLLGCLLCLMTCSVSAAIDINTATEVQLQSVKGIGPSKAKSIVQYRTRHGAFRTVGELANVRGFGGKTLTRLQGELSVSGAGNAWSQQAPLAQAPATSTDHAMKSVKKKGH
ncbi:helix-hairpin-helix domain-containing protein [Burkholderiaceae bacterium DAT-1]|nr:helix-hairpin-helix domain-containing protein [Burkholderiaceae bacterium DAT-1]